jgi:hypothetical protein
MMKSPYDEIFLCWIVDWGRKIMAGLLVVGASAGHFAY